MGLRISPDVARSVPVRIVAATVVLYLVATLMVSAIPGLSRLVHASIAAMALAFVVRMLEAPLRVRLHAPLPMFWAFFTFCALSVLWAPVQNAAVVRVVSLAFDVGGASLVLLALWNGVSVRVVGIAFAAGASIQAAIGLAQYLSGDLLRAEGLTGNANALAIQLAFAAFVLLLAFPKRRWPHLIVWTLVMIATVVSGSRKIVFVWFAYGLVLAKTVGSHFRRSRAATGAFLLLVPAAFGGWLLLGPDASEVIGDIVVVGRIERALAGGDGSFITRGAMIREAMDWWSTSPIWGMGIDQFRYLSSFGTYSHNNFTELLANFGLIGFTLYYGIIAVLFVRAIVAVVAGRTVGWIALALIALILLMDVARVSYTSRLQWTVFAVMTHVLFDPLDHEGATRDHAHAG